MSLQPNEASALVPGPHRGAELSPPAPGAARLPRGPGEDSGGTPLREPCPTAHRGPRGGRPAGPQLQLGSRFSPDGRFVPQLPHDAGPGGDAP